MTLPLPSSPIDRRAHRARAGVVLFAAACIAMLTHPAATAQQPTGRQFQLVQDGKGYKLEMKTVGNGNRIVGNVVVE